MINSLSICDVSKSDSKNFSSVNKFRFTSNFAKMSKALFELEIVRIEAKILNLNRISELLMDFDIARHFSVGTRGGKQGLEVCQCTLALSVASALDCRHSDKIAQAATQPAAFLAI